MFNLIIPFLGSIGRTDLRGPLMATLLWSPPLLALLVMFIDKPSPFRNWAVWLLIVLLYPTLALYHDAVVLIDYVADGKPPTVWVTLLLNATLLPATVLCGGKMLPRRCPGCRRWTSIPLMQLLKKDKRTANTRWCDWCGGEFWKDQERNWRVERRKTWWAAQNEHRST